MWYDERGTGDGPALVNRLVLDFLDDGAIKSMLPLRRASR